MRFTFRKTKRARVRRITFWNQIISVRTRSYAVSCWFFLEFFHNRKTHVEHCSAQVRKLFLSKYLDNKFTSKSTSSKKTMWFISLFFWHINSDTLIIDQHRQISWVTHFFENLFARKWKYTHILNVWAWFMAIVSFIQA